MQDESLRELASYNVGGKEGAAMAIAEPSIYIGAFSSWYNCFHNCLFYLHRNLEQDKTSTTTTGVCQLPRLGSPLKSSEPYRLTKRFLVGTKPDKETLWLAEGESGRSAVLIARNVSYKGTERLDQR